MAYSEFTHPGFFRGEMSGYSLTNDDTPVEVSPVPPGP
jgi:hypothetical protein